LYSFSLRARSTAFQKNTRSRYSRRIVPISRSTNGCETGANGTDLISSTSITRRLASQQPTVKAEKRIVIGTEVFRFALPGGGGIEHSARRHAIDACGADAKADDTTGEDVHDQQDPMAAQDDRFNTKQIDTPNAVFCLSDDSQPGRTIGIRLGSKVYGEHAPHDFVDLDAKGVSDLLGDADTTE